jgi:putative endonuclease
MKGYMYILLCNDGSYYTGSTTDLERRMQQHFSGEGANHTKKHPPVKLLYYEEFGRIDEAFYREKQVQGWSRRKKEALINGQHDKLPELSRSYTVPSTSSEETVPSTGSGTVPSVVEPVETTDNIITTTNS